MKNKITCAADDHQYSWKQRDRVGRRQNTEMLLGKKTVYFSLNNSVYDLLAATAKSRNLSLPGFVQNVVIEWIVHNL